MAAVTALSRSLRQRLFSLHIVITVCIITFGVSTAVVFASAQDSTPDMAATPGATPTPDELQELREQAITTGADQLTLSLTEYNDSGIEGTVTLYDLGDDTLVAIAIEHGGERHPTHIHLGTCGNLEPQPFAPLTTVDDTGTSLSLVDTPLEELIDGDDYAVDLHLSPNELGTLIACANIEGVPVPATPVASTTPPATATLAPTAGATATMAATATPTTAPTPTSTPTTAPSPTPTPSPAPATTTTPSPTPTPPPAPATTTAPSPTPTPSPAPATTTTPSPTPTPPPAPATTTATPPAMAEDGTGGAEAAPGTVATLPLVTFSGLDAEGTVTLRAIDEDTTKITIHLTGSDVTGGHIAHLHRGTCDNLQDEGTIYLASVDSNGISETSVDLPLSTLLNNGWSVNVHDSGTNYDTWLVCGFLGQATGGVTGGQTGVASGKGVPVSVTGAGTDGTSGVGGQQDRTATTLTQNTGVGSGLVWAQRPTTAIVWSLGVFACILAAAAIVLRCGARQQRQPARWSRLGL